jgi:hypothetical protein
VRRKHPTNFKERTLSNPPAGRGAMPRIVIGMPIGSATLPWATALSLMKTVAACKEEGIPLQLEVVAGCSVVSWARSCIADAFLKSDYDLLFWIDADIVFTLDDFFRLVGLAKVHDVVGATYPFKKLPLTCVVNHVGDPGQYQVNGFGCVKVKSMGLGFTVVNRRVMEVIAKGKPERLDPISGKKHIDLFRIDHEGEDIAFFTDVRAAGFDVWLDPSISVGHFGNMIYKADIIESMGLQDFLKQEKKQ